MAISSGISPVSSSDANSRQADLKAFASKLREASVEADKRISERKSAAQDAAVDTESAEPATSNDETGSLINIQA